MPLRISDDDTRLDPSQSEVDSEFKKIADAEEKGTFDDIANNYDKTADDSDENASISKLKDQEEDSGDWNNQWKGAAGGKKKKRVGPIIAIVLMLTGVGAGFGVTGMLGMALIGIKENIFNQVDTLSSISEERNGILMKNRLFGTSTTCVIQVKCKYIGITQKQLDRLEAKGAKLVDAKKNPLTGRYSGTALILESGERIDASKFRSTFRKSSELRGLTRIVMKPRWLAWNDSTAKQVRAAKKLITNPDFGKDDSKKATRQALYKAVSGTTQSISSDSNPANLSEAKADPDYDPTKMGDADPGVALEDINDETQKLRTKALAGEEVKPLSNNIDTVVNKEPFPGKASAAKLFQQAQSFVNPAGIVTDLCTVYQLVNATVIIARVSTLAYTMRYATQFLSLADKMKAGDATSEEVTKAMDILMSPDETGDTFGDSFSYQFSTYGTVNSKPLNASAAGNSIIQLMSSALATTRDSLGGRSVINTTCFVSGALVLTAFIPFVGPLFKSVGVVAKTAIGSGTKAAVKEAIDLAVKSVVTKVGTREARKATSQSILKGLKTVAKNPSTSIFLASYLAERYAVPYAAQQLAGTEFGADTNGVDALDAINTGVQANQAEITKLSGYTTTDSVDTYMKTKTFSQNLNNRYIAEMQSEADPLDINNPYSTSNKLAVSILPVASKFSSILSKPTNITSIPATIISSIKNNFFGQTTASALSTDEARKELNMCQDAMLEANIIRHASCVPAMVFPGVDEIYTTEGEDIVDRLINKGSLDEYGNPTGAFANYLSSCADPNSSILDESTVSNCYQSTSYQLSPDESLFLLDQKILDDEDTSVTAGNQIVGSLTSDSTSVACALGTTDAGTADGWYKGIKIPIRLCDIPGTTNVDPTGSDGATKMRLNSRISGVYLSLVNKMKADLGLETVRVSDAYRSYARQAKYHSAGYNLAAPAGYSNHQLGVAVDFQMPSGNSLGRCVRVGGLCKLPGDSVFDWLDKNGASFGLSQLSSEYWHWQPKVIN